MTIKLFDIENNTVKITEHCYILPWLKVIMDKYPEDYLKVYAYIFYMSCPDSELNPFFLTPADDREDIIIEHLEFDIDTEDEDIQRAILKAKQLYETPTLRAYKAISTMLDNLSNYMETTAITHGRDGNITSLLRAAKDFAAIRDSFKKIYSDLQEEQKQGRVRGGSQLAYDQ